MTKGLICIDIDGTLTPVREQVSEKVVSYLQEKAQQGYRLLFITGRTYAWSVHLLKKLPFPYILASLNGAYVAKMPENRPLATNYIAFSKMALIEPLIHLEEVALILCTGPDQNEKSFLLSRYANDALKAHLKLRRAALSENWTEISDVNEIQLNHFAALRIFCIKSAAPKLQKMLMAVPEVQVAMMKDSYDDRFSLVTVTHSGASKGHAALFVAKHVGNSGPIIACGDDYNDIPMLEIADCKVVMNTAPEDLLKLADVIAPSAALDGLIDGIESALKRF